MGKGWEPSPYDIVVLASACEQGMPSYVFHLHDRPTVPPRTEHVEALDDVEARSLADLRLTLSSEFTHIEVDRDGKELFRLHRDSGEPR